MFHSWIALLILRFRSTVKVSNVPENPLQDEDGPFCPSNNMSGLETVSGEKEIPEIGNPLLENNHEHEACANNGAPSHRTGCYPLVSRGVEAIYKIYEITNHLG